MVLAHLALALAPAQDVAQAAGPGHLVPADTVLYVEARSLRRVEDLLAALGPLLGESGVRSGIQDFLRRETLGGGGLSATDPERPLGLAVIDHGEAPGWTLVTFFPVIAPEKFEAALDTEECAVVASEAGYAACVSVRDRDAYVRDPGGAAIARDMPRATLAVRIDVDALREKHRAAADTVIEAFERGSAQPKADPAGDRLDLQPFIALYIGMLRDFVRSLKRVDLTADVESGWLEFRAILEFPANGPLAAWHGAATHDLRSAAHLLELDNTFNALFGGDARALALRLAPLSAAFALSLPERDALTFARLASPVKEIAAHLGSVVAVTPNVDRESVRASIYAQAADPAALMRAYSSLADCGGLASVGWQLEPRGTEQRESRSVDRYQLTLLPEVWERIFGELLRREGFPDALQSFLGGPGRTVEVCAAGNDVVTSVGQDASGLARALERLALSPKLPFDLERALARVAGASPCALLRWAQDLQEGDPQSEPAHVTCYIGVRGSDLTCGVVLDAQRLGSGIAEYQQRARHEVARVDIRTLSDAVASYRRVHGKLPSSLEVLVVPDQHGNTFVQARAVPHDPWGRTYVYVLEGPGSDPGFRIRSLGSDGEPGGSGAAADIDSRELEAR